MVEGELAEKIAISVVGGFSKDAIKSGISFFGEKLKAELRKLLLTDAQINAIENIARQAPTTALSSENAFRTYMTKEAQRIINIAGDYYEIARGAYINGGEFVGHKETHYHQYPSPESSKKKH